MIDITELLIQKIEGRKLPATGFVVTLKGGDIYITQADWEQLKKEMQIWNSGQTTK